MCVCVYNDDDDADDEDSVKSKINVDSMNLMFILIYCGLL